MLFPSVITQVFGSLEKEVDEVAVSHGLSIAYCSDLLFENDTHVHTAVFPWFAISTSLRGASAHDVKVTGVEEIKLPFI